MTTNYHQKRVKTLLPREKLLKKGVATLSETELVSILLNSGSKSQSVFELAQIVLDQYPIAQWPQTSIYDFSEIKGLGHTKACTLLAVAELMHRATTSFPPAITTAQEVVSHLTELRTASQEKMITLYCNARSQLVGQQLVSVGSLNQAVVHPRDIFSHALTYPCTAIILAHNHPSGVVEPSHADKVFTQKIAQAGKLLGIPVLDHLIITTDSFFSFREAGLLEDPI